MLCCQGKEEGYLWIHSVFLEVIPVLDPFCPFCVHTQLHTWDLARFSLQGILHFSNPPDQSFKLSFGESQPLARKKLTLWGKSVEIWTWTLSLSYSESFQLLYLQQLQFRSSSFPQIGTGRRYPLTPVAFIFHETLWFLVVPPCFTHF